MYTWSQVCIHYIGITVVHDYGCASTRSHRDDLTGFTLTLQSVATSQVSDFSTAGYGCLVPMLISFGQEGWPLDASWMDSMWAQGGWGWTWWKTMSNDQSSNWPTLNLLLALASLGTIIEYLPEMTKPFTNPTIWATSRNPRALHYRQTTSNFPRLLECGCFRYLWSLEIMRSLKITHLFRPLEPIVLFLG